MGRIVLGVAISGAVVGLASFALYEVDAITSDTSAELGLISLGATGAAVVLGFALRNRVRHARDGMFVGLSTLSAWFLLLLYALSQDTP